MLTFPLFSSNTLSTKKKKLWANIASEHVTLTLVTGTTAATFYLFEKVSQLTVKECIHISAPKSCELDPIPSKVLLECLVSILPSLTDLFNSSLASSHNASNQLLSHLFSKKRCIDHNDLHNYRSLSQMYALLLLHRKNLSYPMFLPTSTLTIFTILINQHIVQVTVLKQLYVSFLWSVPFW